MSFTTANVDNFKANRRQHFKLLEENKNLRASLEFSQAEIKELKESNKKLMTRIQALEKQESLTNKKLQDLEEKCDEV